MSCSQLDRCLEASEVIVEVLDEIVAPAATRKCLTQCDGEKLYFVLCCGPYLKAAAVQVQPRGVMTGLPEFAKTSAVTVWCLATWYLATSVSCCENSSKAQVSQGLLFGILLLDRSMDKSWLLLMSLERGGDNLLTAHDAQRSSADCKHRCDVSTSSYF